MNFWKEHVSLRLAIITVFFVLGLALVIVGWKMAGKLLGLGIMVVGLVLLLAALMIYNKPYGDSAGR